jgi:hypothetical protein
MKTNNLLTYLLYALLVGLIAALGYKACQMKKEKQALKDQQEAELQKTLHDMGYNAPDTTAAAGSSYAGASKSTAPSTTGKTPGSAAKNGIEDDQSSARPSASTGTKPVMNSIASNAPTTSVKGNQSPAANAAPVLPPVKGSTTAKKGKKTVRDLDHSTSGGRYRVQAGSFSQVAHARNQLQTVIKMGYPKAEIGHTNNGKYAVVVVMKTNNKAEAIQVADKLEARGVDATVMENGKKLKKHKAAPKAKAKAKAKSKVAPKPKIPAKPVSPAPITKPAGGF